MRWILVSVALSVALTVLLNAGLRAFPNAGRRLSRVLAEAASSDPHRPREMQHQMRVVVPWKAMVVASVVLTVVLNVALWLI